MANAVKLLITVDDKGSAKIKTVEQNFNKLKKSVSSGSNVISKGFNKIKGAAGKMSGAMKKYALAGKLALAGLATATILVGAKFEQGMANVASVANASKQELAELTAVARHWGKQTAFSATQASEAMYSLASAGQKTGEISASIGPVLQFAGATATDLGAAAEQTVQALKQFGLEASETSRVTNVFAAGIANSMLTSERLKESLSEVGTVASGMGMSIEDTVANIGLLHNAGQVGSKAGTTLKNALVQLASPNETLAALLGDVSLKTHTFAQVIDHLRSRTKDTGQLMEAFGRIAGPGMVALLNEGSAGIDEMTKKITGTNEAARMYEQQMDTVSNQFKIFKSAMEENMIATFDQLKPVIRDVLAGMIAWAEKLRPFIVGLVTVIAKFVKENWEVIKVLGKVAAIVGTVMAVIVGWKVILIGALVAGIFYAIKFKDKVKGAFSAVGEFVKKIVDKIIGFFRDLLSKVGWLLSKLIPGFDEWAESIKDTIGEKVGQAVDKVKEKAGDVKDAVGDMAKDVRQKVQETLASIEATGQAAAPAPPAEAFVGPVMPDTHPEFMGPAQPQKFEIPVEAQFVGPTIDPAILEARAAKARQIAKAANLGIMADVQATDYELYQAKLALIEDEYEQRKTKAGDNIVMLAEAELQKANAVADAKMEYDDLVMENYMANHQMQMNMLSVLEAGYNTFFDTILEKEMTGKQRREAMWKSMKKTFIRNTAEMMKAWIVSRLKAIVIGAAAEEAANKKSRISDAKKGAIRAYSAFAAVPFIGPVLGAAAAAAAFAFLMTFHKGGLVPGIHGEYPALVQPGEYVIQRSSVESIGARNLEYMNRSGALPETPVGDLNFNLYVNGDEDPEEIRLNVETKLVPMLESMIRRRRFNVKVKEG